MKLTYLKARLLLGIVSLATCAAAVAHNIPFAFLKMPSQAGNPPVKLAFTSQPSWSNMAGVTLSNQPVVSIQDVNGDTVTSATHAITLAAFKDSSCTVAATAGTLNVTTNPLAASSGVASFSGVSFSIAGTIYLKATASGLTSACSTLVTMNDSPGTITYVNSFTGFTTSAACATATVSTTVPNELLFAHAYDYYSTCSGAVAVSGAGLTWTKVVSSGGISSAWAVAPTVLTNATISFCNCMASDGRTLIVSTYKNVDVNSPIGGTNKGLGTSSTGSVALNTIRNNSLVISEITTSSGATIAGSGTTLLNATVTATKKSASGRQSSLTASKGTSVTSSYSLGSTLPWEVSGFELQPYLSPATTPTLDSVWTGDNGAGAIAFSIDINTQEANELVLLAVTWRSASPLPSVPTIGGQDMIPVATISQGSTVTTQIFRYMPSTQLRVDGGSSTGTVYIAMQDSSTKATAVVATFRGVNISGTMGSGAVSAIQTTNGTTANPTNNLTTTASNSLVVSFLGYAKDGTGLAVGSGFTLGGSTTSSGGGSAGTKATTALQLGNSLVASPSTVSVPWTLPAVDWTKVDIAIKP